MPSFTIKQQDNSYLIEGELTFFSIDKKSINLFDFIKQNKINPIDLKAINVADSAGLALIIEWIKLSKINNTQLILKNIPQQLLTLAKLSNLDIENFS